MSGEGTQRKKDYLTIVLSIVGLIVVFELMIDIFKDVKKNTSSDVVSDEGKEILSDPKKRKNLQAAIDHYRKEGNWDLLHKVAE